MDATAASAKINLFLEVAGRRPDGYHDLVTVMAETSLCDHLSLEALPAQDGGPPRDSLVLEGWPQAAPGLPEPQGADNLALRALDGWRRYLGPLPPVQVHLRKIIPVGAGLGGGSSDAAAVLRWAGGGRADSAIRALAATLGADVPFFLRGGWQLAEGMGERLSPLAPPKGDIWRIRLYVPPWRISTAQAFRALDSGAGGGPARDAAPLLRALETGDRDVAGVASFNRFEYALGGLEPRQAGFMESIRRLGGRPARLSGSGSAVWCWADGPPDAAQAEDEDWRGRLARAGWPGARVISAALRGGDH